MLNPITFVKSSSSIFLSFSKHLPISLTGSFRTQARRSSGYPSLMANLSTVSTQTEQTQKSIQPLQVFPVVNFLFFVRFDYIFSNHCVIYVVCVLDSWLLVMGYFFFPLFLVRFIGLTQFNFSSIYLILTLIFCRWHWFLGTVLGLPAYLY